MKQRRVIPLADGGLKDQYDNVAYWLYAGTVEPQLIISMKHVDCSLNGFKPSNKYFIVT
jgi:hypothetical protein